MAVSLARASAQRLTANNGSQLGGDLADGGVGLHLYERERKTFEKRPRKVGGSKANEHVIAVVLDQEPNFVPQIGVRALVVGAVRLAFQEAQQNLEIVYGNNQRRDEGPQKEQ